MILEAFELFGAGFVLLRSDSLMHDLQVFNPYGDYYDRLVRVEKHFANCMGYYS